MMQKLAPALVAGSLMLASLPQCTNTVRASSTISGRCLNVQLTIGLFGNPGGAASRVALIYRIHDLWEDSCTLRGYPGIELLDRSFHSLPTHLTDGQRSLIGRVSERKVVLNSRRDAYFVVSYIDEPVGTKTCLRAPYLLIIPPGDRLPVVIFSRRNDSPSYFAPCGGDIAVSPVTAAV